MQEFYHIIGFFFVIQVTNSRVLAGELGSTCGDDRECNVENSRCYQKQCSCLPFYAVYNSTVCLQSNMLGFECLVSEQCSKKVANSDCIGGICRCEPGFLQYRRHTCLTAARLGEICYSDKHCRLWDDESHCDFMIANLFGRCSCNAPLEQSRSGTCQPNVPPPSTSTAQSFDIPHPVITKTEMQVTANKTTQSSSKPLSTASSNNKFQNQVPKPPPYRVKPDVKPSNQTDKPTKPSKPTKPDRPTKPENPTKKPSDQKFQFSQFLNKTQQQLEHLGDKLASFYQAAANAKPSKLIITAKPSKTSANKAKTTSKPAFTSTVRPASTTSANQQSTTRTSKPPIKSETIIKQTDQKNQADKILVVNNSVKKPIKNKFSGINKTGIKNPFLASFPFLNGNSSLEETLPLRYPVNLNKQIETMLADVEQKLQKEKAANTTSVSIGPLHHRVAEDLTSPLSLGYTCKTDSQCMKNDNNSRCISGVCDCVTRRTRYDNACSARNRGCHKGTFQCKSSGTCISWFFVCDGRKDCSDGSDEDCKDKESCPEQTFRCGSTIPAVCISQASRCDGNVDCPNGEDEYNCTATKYKNCPLHTFQCEDGRCLPEYEFCNAVISCADGSDEPYNSCTATWSTSVRSLQYCPFRCTNGRCRSSAVVCSGRDGCGDNSDENKCSICKCPPAAA